MANTTKVTAEGWVDAAKEALIAEGVSGVKVDRLARTLGVTRGGFYHNFKSRRDLLARLLDHWRRTNRLIPDLRRMETPADAIRALDVMVRRLIAEEEFSPSFDLAIREWARVDDGAKTVVDAVDAQRMRELARIFRTLGCDRDEAGIRAKVFYFHQIGYYALGYNDRESTRTRLSRAPTFLRILCGQKYRDASEAQTSR